MQDHIQARFNESIQTQVATADSIGPAIGQAAEKCVHALLGGQSIFVCGDESASFISAHFATLLLYGCELERPPFPAIHLSHRAAADVESNCYARQVSALGKAGDILIVFVTKTHDDSIHNAMTAALSRDMSIISISGDDPGDFSGLLGAGDVEIRIPSTATSRILEQQLFCARIFSDLIEAKIFGGL
ncbi:D-sedoheptulose-7-phosphate isomerase [Aliidiomarina celeris]|uniref:D-sedoheptulose-7-phosphate isomerase n=1 Tax=Aliidiomarina celeris TaxID=2249428 RepID=UPI000DE976A6|nr:SIS domain-containing protein [Aliidiomarina celeris]